MYMAGFKRSQPFSPFPPDGKMPPGAGEIPLAAARSSRTFLLLYTVSRLCATTGSAVP